MPHPAQTLFLCAQPIDYARIETVMPASPTPNGTDPAPGRSRTVQPPRACRFPGEVGSDTVYYCWHCTAEIGHGIDSFQWSDACIAMGGCTFCSTECLHAAAHNFRGWRARYWKVLWWSADMASRMHRKWRSWVWRVKYRITAWKRKREEVGTILASDAPRTCRLLDTADPTTVYVCWNCGKEIGLRSKVVYRDKTDRSYCSSECQSAARNHPSWEYECRGGDY